MKQGTLKTSTIYVSVGERMRVYRKVDDIPSSLREKMEQSTKGMNAATILIADRNGRSELMRALRGAASGLGRQDAHSGNSRRDPGRNRRFLPGHRWLGIAAVASVLGAAACVLAYLR
jgi:hypothetical protein